MYLKWAKYSETFDKNLHFRVLECDGQGRECTVKQKIAASDTPSFRMGLSGAIPKELAVTACTPSGICSEKARLSEWHPIFCFKFLCFAFLVYVFLTRLTHTNKVKHLATVLLPSCFVATTRCCFWMNILV